MKKRLFAGLLAICLTVNLMSATAFATETSACLGEEICVDGVHVEGCELVEGHPGEGTGVALYAEESVAKIGDTPYTTLQDAINNVKDDETITLLGDVKVTEPAYGQNALNYTKAVSCTIDLGGYTLSADTGNSVFRFNISKSNATSDVTVTLKNGKVIAGENTWCAVMATGISSNAKAMFNLENLTVESSKAGDLAVKAWSNSLIKAQNVTINASKGSGGFYSVGGEIVLDNCVVEQKGLHTAPYLSTAVAVSNGGKMTINSGKYTTKPTAVSEGSGQGNSHGSWCASIMSSGGTMIINDGEFENGYFTDPENPIEPTYPRELISVGADADYGEDVKANLIINGGAFASIGDLTHCETIWPNDKGNPDWKSSMVISITGGNFEYKTNGKAIGGCDPISTGNKVQVSISGGQFSSGIENVYCADGYEPKENADGTYGVTQIVYAAAISGEKYRTLEKAIESVQSDESITILNDISLDNAVDIPAGKEIVLDLNGKTIAGTDAVTASFGLINIQPGADLTIVDSSENKTGKITLKATNNRGWNAYSSVISNQRGKLTVDGGTIEHLGGTDMAYGIDNLTNGKGTYAETVINSGTIKSPYRAIRQFLNGVEADNILTVNGGTIEGKKNSIWMQDPNKYANTGKLSVSENANIRGNVYFDVTDGSTEWPVEISVAKASLKNGSVLVADNIPARYSILESNGIYRVVCGDAMVGDTVYNTFAEAVAAADGKTVTLRDNVTLTESLVIPTGKSVTLDLNGKTLNGNIFVESGAKAIVKNGKVVNENSSKSAIESNGELTVKDVTVTSARHAIRVEAGTAVIDGGNYSLITTNGMTQHVVNVSGTGTKVTIKAGTFVGPANSSSDSGAAVNVQAGATVTIEGGTFDGGKNDTLAAAGTLVVSAGKFDQNPAKYVVKTSHVIEKNGAFEVHTITYVAEKSASCKGTGTAAHYKCNTCGKLYKDAAGATAVTADKLVIGAKGHNYSTKSDASGHWSQCSRCGDVKDKEGHSYSNGKCSCGHETKVEVYVPETPAPAPTTPAPAPTTTTTTKTQTTTTTKPVEAAKPVETPVEEVVVNTKIVEEVATEEVKAVVKETVTVAEVKEVEKETETGTVTVTEVKVAVTTETIDKVIENTEAGATVILPLTEAAEEGQAVTEAEVAVEALEKIVEAETALTVEFEGVKVTLEADTIKAIAEQAQGSTIELRVVPVEHHELNDEQKAVLEAHDVAVRVSAQIFSDGEYIGDFKGGKATIAIPFTPEEGKAAEDHKVYFVDDNGEMTLMPAVYVDGHMVFETTHFSDYVIVYDEVASVEEGPSPVDDDMTVEAPVEEVQEEAGLPIVPIIIVVVAVILVVAFIATRNKKDEE